MGEGGARKEVSLPPTIGAAWSELRANTASKTLPQLLVAACYWVGVMPRSLQTPAHIPYLAAMVAALWFFAIVIRRLFATLPWRGFFYSYLSAAPLFLGYTIWLGYGPPVNRKDVREWLAWIAMASGLVTVLLFAFLR